MKRVLGLLSVLCLCLGCTAYGWRAEARRCYQHGGMSYLGYQGIAACQAYEMHQASLEQQYQANSLAILNGLNAANRARQVPAAPYFPPTQCIQTGTALTCY